MVHSLAGRRVLITGAAGGFGRVLTNGFAAAGAKVLACDVDQGGLEDLQTAIHSAGLSENVTPHRLDISDWEACAAAAERAREINGAIDILINNGAMGMQVFGPHHMTNLVTIEDVTPETWDRFVAINFSGAWYMTKAAIADMKANGWGRIINVTTSFFTMLRGKFHPYGPAKAGLEAMSAGHAAEFAPDGITVNIVVPGGPSDTAMVPAEAPFARSDLIAPEKMLAPMLWLCSEAANGITGNRYVAANWDTDVPVAQARAASESPIAWPDLAAAPVWPGGRPNA